MAATEHGVPSLPADVLVAGASGLIGSALALSLRAKGLRVRALVRRTPQSTDEVYWNPLDGTIDRSAIEAVGALVNFSGENIANGRWSARRRQQILESRIATTETLARTLSRALHRPTVWINASAVGYYGNRGREVLNEESGAGRGFLANVCEQWEAATHVSAAPNLRVVYARFGIVLSRNGGALAKLLPIFRARLGGRLGRGDQWMSWVSVQDAVRALEHVLTNPHCSEAVNIVAPAPVTNREFTDTLARALRRSARFPVPAFALRCAFGTMADETLLASQRVAPAKLLATGFEFLHPTLEIALQALVGRGQI
jgi:uncharacterized protein (TIGR01777 family)